MTFIFHIFGFLFDSNGVGGDVSFYSLDSAGDGGFKVSGLIQSDGDGDRSRFVVMCPSPRDRPAAWLRESERWPKLLEWPKWVPGKPSGILFSDKNSSKSAYYGEEKCLDIMIH